MESFSYKAKLYKIRLAKTERDIFGNPIPSDKWDVLVKALDDDLRKKKEFKFIHPRSKKTFYRHYKESPANGVTRLVIGQFNDRVHFAYVRILLNSYLYKEPYLVIERYDTIVRNPDYLAEMVARAFNWALEGSGQEVMLEPWETHGETITWSWDYDLSYDYQLRQIKGENLIKAGFEDSLEEHQKMKERAKTRGSKKSDNIKLYIKKRWKDHIVSWLHGALKGLTSQKELSMPFRVLYDGKVTDHIPYKAVIKEFSELKGILKENRYNDWTNSQRTSCKGEFLYLKLNEDFENSILDIEDQESA